MTTFSLGEDDVKWVSMSWGGNDCSSFWMNVTRRCTKLSVQVQQGRQQKRDLKNHRSSEHVAAMLVIINIQLTRYDTIHWRIASYQ